jgi:LPXTG-site transpeptidase (sortase) family protein
MEQLMQIPQRLRSPVILGPVVLLALIGGAVYLAPVLTEDPDTQAAELYADATEESATAVAATTPPSILNGPEASTDDRGQGIDEDAPALLKAAPARMRIERLGIEAPLVTIGINADGNMAAPDGPELIGWYDFTAKPGTGSGNAVVAGHRDWRGYGPAVFWELEDLERGDIIEVELLDGSLVRYAVTAGHTYPVADLDMREILARTEEETLTLITCAGDFEDHDYTDRHVVRAVRIGAVPAQATLQP